MDLTLSISRAAALSVLAVLCAIPTAALEKHCSIRPARYRGWSAQEIRNEWATLTIVPRLGGRLMQVTFGRHDYLFVNKEYEGKYLPPVERNAPPQWYNYGGDKIFAKTLRGVTPREAVKVDAEVQVPAGAKRAALYLIDSRVREWGLLDEVPVAPGGMGD